MRLVFAFLAVALIGCNESSSPLEGDWCYDTERLDELARVQNGGMDPVRSYSMRELSDDMEA